DVLCCDQDLSIAQGVVLRLWGGQHETARVYHAPRRRGGRMAAWRARTAAGAADGRVYQPPFSAKLRATLVRLSQRAWRNRLRRWPQCGDRIPLRGVTK